MLNRSEFNFLIIEPLVSLIYAAFRGKNEYNMTQIHDFDPILGFSCDNHTWWPIVQWVSGEILQHFLVQQPFVQQKFYGLCNIDLYDNIGVGGGTAFSGAYPARAYTTSVVLVMIYGTNIGEIYAIFGKYIAVFFNKIIPILDMIWLLF